MQSRADAAPTAAVPGAELERLEMEAAAVETIRERVTATLLELRGVFERHGHELTGELETVALATVMVVEGRRRDVGFGELLAAVGAAWKAERHR